MCPGTVLHAAQKGSPAKVTALQNQKYVDALLSGIRGAKREIVGCFFLFKVSPGKHGLPEKIVNELIAARRRGVDVSIELEQEQGGRGAVYEQNRYAAQMLSSAGVNVRFDAPRTTTHVKAMVVDGRYVYLGSHNLTQSALKYNNELSVMIDSPDFAAEVLGYLDSL
jgi:phosphatidylserine/phosphatidylglycerophosphate/cardiolipin synthase-like enzyme